MGRITNIQRFSLNDGDGIRTTVFLSGCNMRCAWCHNPETLFGKGRPLFYERKCIGCGHCLDVCPTGARAKSFDTALCIGCGSCAGICYPGAIVMPAKEATAEDVVREAKQDVLYYRYSQGGVTFSGGEALCQADFVSECADALAKEGIASAVETNLFHPFEKIEPALRKMRLIMADLKLMDPSEHAKWTGVSNELILENAERIGELGIPIIFRTPLIPGVTDSVENLRAAADFTAKIPNVRCYELLNFNPLGADKYTALRENNPFRDARPLSKSKLDVLRQALSDADVTVKIS